MATAYTSLLGLALPVTGELQGTWGTTVNDSITSLLDTAVAGTTTLSADTDVTLSTTTGAANQARQAILLCSGARTVLRTITAPAQSKIYTVINATTGGFSVKLVGVGPTTGVTVVAGESALVAWNGSDFIKISNTGGAASFTNVTVSGTTTLSGLTASTALALNGSKEVVSVTNTGTGNNVLSASPTLTGTISAAAATLSSDLTLSGGTANGVLYLNGSKVATSGSALTFDGASLTVGASAGAGQHILRTYTNASGFAAIYNGGVTPGGSNYSFITTATQTTLNATTFVSTELGGSEQMRLTSTGLGIGTSSPGQKLTVQGGVNVTSSATLSAAQGSMLFSYESAVNRCYMGDGTGYSFAFSKRAASVTTDLMTLTDTGNLGIGTSSPSAKLTVYDTSNSKVLSQTTTGYAQFQASSSSGDFHIAIDNSTGAGFGAGAYSRLLYSTGVYPMVFFTNATERMRLDSSGNLGIGTTPLVKLDVKGTTDTHVGMTATATDEALILAFDDVGVRTPNLSYAAASHKFLIAGDEKMRLDSSGNLGLGVTPGTWAAAAKALDFVYPAFGMDADGAAFMSFNARNTTGSTWVYKTTDEAALFTATAGGEFTWRRAASGTAGNAISFGDAKMTLDASGNLLLAGTTAYGKFTVNNAGTGSVGFNAGTISSPNRGNLFYDTDGTGWDFRIGKLQSGTFTAQLTLNDSGNLGLGVTPSAWATAGGQRALQVGSITAVWQGANGGAGFGFNAYESGSNSYTYLTTNPASFYQHDGSHRWFTALSGTAGNAISFGDAKMTLDASGNLGVGATSPAGDLHVQRADAAELILQATNSGGRQWFIQTGDTASGLDGALRFYDATAAAERARITSGGDLLVGTTSGTGYKLRVYEGGANLNASIFTNQTATYATQEIWNQATSGDNVFLKFYTEGSATARGSIDYDRAGGLVRYNTTSDYRAKDIIGPVQDPGATIDALKVYEGVMKGATQSRPMLIAHEAQAVAPYAVSGVKDEVNEDGTPKFQQMDVSSLVPLLLAEIQSLRARVAALEAK